MAAASPQTRLVAALATPLVIAGYPLLETLRTCHLQTSVSANTGYGRAPMGQLSHSNRRWTHEDRDIVTPANDLLYFCAWVNLRQQPAWLDVPAPTGRYFVVEMLDAYTENFINLGPRNVPAEGARFMLCGPSTPAQSAEASLGAHRVDCPSDLVWLLGRVLVSGDDDVDAAREFMAQFRLTGSGARPASVNLWREGGDPALDFFANLISGLDEFPSPEPGADLAPLLTALGWKRGDADAPQRANARVQQGLQMAWREGMALIEAHSRSQTRKAWGYSTQLGRWQGRLMMRAATALKGLGALCGEETIYAMSDFDAMGEPLSGEHRYVLRFPPGQLPPADAFWSVSMYGEDRFFVDHPARRYAVGDRTAGLEFDADGSLTLPIQHEQPTALRANWLPAPRGRFYLILRLYHPRPEFLAGRYDIPALQRVEA